MLTILKRPVYFVIFPLSFSSSFMVTVKMVPWRIPLGTSTCSEISVQLLRSGDTTAPYLCSVYLSKYTTHWPLNLKMVGPSAQYLPVIGSEGCPYAPVTELLVAMRIFFCGG